MASFLTMQTRIASELQRSDVAAGTTANKDAINSAANHYMQFRFWFNETSTTASTVAGTATYNTPTRFVELDRMTLTSGTTVYPVRPVTSAEIDEMYSSTSERGRPTCFAAYNQQFRLFPTPDAVYTLTYYYLISYAALSADADTNVWTTEAEELTRTRAKKLIALNIRDLRETIPMLEQHEQAIFAALQKRSQAAVSSGRLRGWAI